MEIRYLKYLIFLPFLLILAWTLSCSGRSGAKGELKKEISLASADETTIKLIKIISPEENNDYKLNQVINVEIEPVFKNRIPDSISVYYDSKLITVLKSEPWKCSVPGEMLSTTGRKALKIIGYRDGKMQNPLVRFLVIYSDVVPEIYKFKVVHTYPHDKHAFTQGLFFDNGSLYESTGQETESSLREVDLATGRVLRQLNLDASLFGEGITLYNGKIFQVTWRNKIGFVYEKESFRQINKIYYPTEGWGLTTSGDMIIMSDGTNILYYFEPEMFTSVSRIEVYDNEKKVDNLNELEYINGEIWANIWTEDRIVRIDPTSGKVKAYIDLSGLFPQHERNPEAEVLNGIAYDQKANRIFVTGKRWSKLFEISIIK